MLLVCKDRQYWGTCSVKCNSFILVLADSCHNELCSVNHILNKNWTSINYQSKTRHILVSSRTWAWSYAWIHNGTGKLASSNAVMQMLNACGPLLALQNTGKVAFQGTGRIRTCQQVPEPQGLWWYYSPTAATGRWVPGAEPSLCLFRTRINLLSEQWSNSPELTTDCVNRGMLMIITFSILCWVILLGNSRNCLEIY